MTRRTAPNDPWPQLTHRLKACRAQQQRTQAQFARSLGVSRPALGAYEEGRATPPLGVLLRYGALLNCTINELPAPLP